MRTGKKLKFILIITVVLLVFTAGLSACGASLPQGRTFTVNTGQNRTGGKSTETGEEIISLDKGLKDVSGTGENGGGFTLTMLNVGQGLAILIEADGHYMMYDGGGREASSYVVSYLKEQKITGFDCLIASHYDEDHIAGLVGVLRNYDVGNLICPDYQADSKIYQSFVDASESNGAALIHPQAGERYSLGGAVISILGPFGYDEEKENNNSIAVKLTYGNFSCILTGDAEKEEEQAIIDSGADLATDLYVVGHHGSSGSTSDAFLKAMSPSVVWISCGSDNSYGHPAQKTMEKLKEAGIALYRTDLLENAKTKEVTCYADGNSYWFDQEASNDYSPGEKN